MECIPVADLVVWSFLFGPGAEFAKPDPWFLIPTTSNPNINKKTRISQKHQL
jgi:hypothetical protein